MSHKHIFLTVPVGRHVGLTSASIGLFRTLDRLGVPLGFFKALGQPHQGETFDRSSAYLRNTGTEVSVPPIPDPLVTSHLAEGKIDDLMERVVERFDTLPAHQTSVIVEGIVPTAGLPNADEINAALARAINAEIIFILRPTESTVLAISKQLSDALSRLPASLLDVKPAVIINQFDAAILAADLGLTSANSTDLIKALRLQIQSLEPRCEIIGLVPSNTELTATRVKDIIGELKGEIIHTGDMEGRRVKEIRLCARNVENLLHVFKTGTLVVTPGDRSDIIAAAALAATKSIHLAGLVLTGNLDPCQQTLDFCQDAFSLDGGLPIFKVSTGSFETARDLSDLNPEIPIEDVQRIHLVMDTISRGIDTTWLRERCATSIESRLSPPAFRHRLSKIARDHLQRIILPEGDEPRTILAAIQCASRGIAQCILLGNPKQIQQVIRVNGLTTPKNLVILDPEPIRDRYLQPLLDRRAGKGLTHDGAIEALRDNIVLGTMMLALDEVDGLVSGAIHSTAHTIRPALQLIKTHPDAKAVSSVFFMCLPDQVLVYGDCAVNPDPDAELLADIAIQSAASAKAFGIEPIVAMISYSTLGSGSGSNVDKVREATEIARRRDPSLIIDGPLQYDAASIREVAAAKAPDSLVAGRANVFIFPDLNTGNTTYKAVQRSANVISMGPMLQGLRKPVNDLSRGASIDDIIYTIALTAIQAQQIKPA